MREIFIHCRLVIMCPGDSRELLIIEIFIGTIKKLYIKLLTQTVLLQPLIIQPDSQN